MMKNAILAAMVVMVFGSVMVMDASAQRLVYCKRIGELNGPVVTFENFCPVGWVQVR